MPDDPQSNPEHSGVIFRSSVKAQKTPKTFVVPVSKKKSLLRAASENLSESFRPKSFETDAYSKSIDFPLSSLGYIKSNDFSVKKHDQLVNTLCCWLPIPYYELWIIFTIIGYFSIWCVLVILVLIFIFYGITLCRGGFTLLENDLIHKWLKTKNLYFVDDPRYVENNFNIRTYLEDVLENSQKILFKRGLLMILFGVIQLASHCHGFYSFYFRHALNLLAYSIALLIFFVITLTIRTSFTRFSDDVITTVFRNNFIAILDQKDCSVCVPKAGVTTFKWPEMSITDFLLKFQACTLKCCGIQENERISPFQRVLRPLPIVCCKSFHNYMFRNDTVFNFPLQLKCAKTITNVNLKQFPFTNATCQVSERIPSCRSSITGTIYYNIFEKFNSFMTVFITVLSGYYIAFCVISALYMIERFYTRRRVLKDIHRRLINYQV